MINRKFRRCHYDKKISFSFDLKRMPYLDNDHDMLSRIFYSLIDAKILRICKANNVNSNI